MRKLILSILMLLITTTSYAATVYPRADAAYKSSAGGYVLISSRAQVWVYSAGTTSLATLYLTSAGTTTTTNPVVADTSGNFSYYAAAGFYDEIVVGPAGTTPVNRYSVPVGVATTAIAGFLVEHDAIGTHSNITPSRLGTAFFSSRYASLNAVHAAAASVTDSVIILDWTSSLSSNLTTTVPIMWSGGIISCGTSTILINGSLTVGDSQVFHSNCGVGDVTFGPGIMKYVSLELWGEKPDGTDDTVAMDSAIASMDAPVIRLGSADENTPGYRFNITISKPNVTILGAGRRSTVIRPYVNSPVITIDSTAIGFQSTTIKDLELSNYTGAYPSALLFSSPGIYTTGTGISDNHLVERVTIWGFTYGILFNGRTTGSIFRDVEILFSSIDAVRIEANSDTVAFHLNTFDNVLFNNSTGNGITVKDSGSTGWLTNSWRNCNFQSNGVDGFRLDGGTGGLAGGGGIFNSYFESNTGKNIYLTGTSTAGFSVENNLIWASTAGIDYQNDTTLSYGKIKGNRFSGAINIAVTGSQSLIEIGGNYGGTFNITPDSNGFSHAVFTDKNGSAITTYIGGQTWIQYGSIVEVSSGVTISTIPSGVLGQKIDIINTSASTTVTLAHGTATDAIYTAKTNTVSLGPGQAITLYKTQTYWREISRSTPTI